MTGYQAMRKCVRPHSAHSAHAKMRPSPFGPVPIRPSPFGHSKRPPAAEGFEIRHGPGETRVACRPGTTRSRPFEIWARLPRRQLSPRRQVVEIQDGIKHQEVTAFGLGAPEGVVRKEQHMTFTQGRVNDGGVLG